MASVAFSIWSMGRNTNKKMNVCAIIGTLFSFTIYKLSSNDGISILTLVIFIRSLIYSCLPAKIKENSVANIIPVIACIVQAIVITTDFTLASIAPLISCWIASCTYWKGSPQMIRWGNVIGSVLWSIFNILSGLYIAEIGTILSILSSAYWIWCNRESALTEIKA